MKFQHAGEVRDTTRRQGIDWSGTDRIYSDIVLAKICGKVSCARFKGRLGDAHNVIIGDNLFCSVVGHTDYASPFVISGAADLDSEVKENSLISIAVQKPS